MVFILERAMNLAQQHTPEVARLYYQKKVDIFPLCPISSPLVYLVLCSLLSYLLYCLAFSSFFITLLFIVENEGGNCSCDCLSGCYFRCDAAT